MPRTGELATHYMAEGDSAVWLHSGPFITFRRWEMVLDDPGRPRFITRVLKCERRRQQSPTHEKDSLALADLEHERAHGPGLWAGSGNWIRQGYRWFPRASRQECSPADTSISAQGDSFQISNSDLQNCKIKQMSILGTTEFVVIHSSSKKEWTQWSLYCWIKKSNKRQSLRHRWRQYYVPREWLVQFSPTGSPKIIF